MFQRPSRLAATRSVLLRSGFTALLLRASDFPVEHHDRIFGIDCPNGNVRRAKNHRAGPTGVLLREYAFDCDAALASFTAHRGPIRVVSVQPAQRANIMAVPGIYECIGERSLS
jgi:hypothetical protein